VIHGRIIGPNRVAKRDGRKIGLLALALRARNEADDFCTHENPSHIAIAIRPASASEIKYAVIGGSLLELSLRHDRKGQRSFRARTHIPQNGGAACGRGLRATPRAVAFARAGFF
jgi:hypothetical protein